uniref:Uncharacterized protein n=1 Tax=Salix viminalis TaxID=40686 RepID=A0A6N2KGV1_SALVM
MEGGIIPYNVHCLRPLFAFCDFPPVPCCCFGKGGSGGFSTLYIYLLLQGDEYNETPLFSSDEYSVMIHESDVGGFQEAEKLVFAYRTKKAQGTLKQWLKLAVYLSMVKL